MFNLSVNIGHEESIEVVLQPFEAQFSSPEQSTTSDGNSGLLQSSVNIRHTRRSSFHFDEVDKHDALKMNYKTKLTNLENARNEIVAIDQKIQSMLRKYKKPTKGDTSSVKSVSTTSTMECASLSSITSSFSDEGFLRAGTGGRKFNGVPKKLEIPVSITTKSLGALSLKSLEIK